jgi:hypothetical protein
MERNTIIKKALIKLTSPQKNEINQLVGDLEKIYLKHKKSSYEDTNFSRDIVRLMQDIVKESDFEQTDKLYLFNELKKKNMFNWNLNKHLEKAWRFLFKKWGLPNLNFS